MQQEWCARESLRIKDERSLPLKTSLDDPILSIFFGNYPSDLLSDLLLEPGSTIDPGFAF